MRRADMICSTWIKTLGSVSFAHRSLFTKIVLHRIISIVRFLTVQCNLDRSINRDDDEKRSPLIVRHVEGFVYVTICRRRLMKVPFPPITREMEEVIAFWAVSCIDWSRSEQHKETDMNMILSWKRYQRWRLQGRSSRILFRRHYSCSAPWGITNLVCLSQDKRGLHPILLFSYRRRAYSPKLPRKGE